MGMLRVRGLLLIGWLLAALGAGPGAAEEGYPSRLVRVIVPFPPGSTLDALARIVTDQLAHKWAEPVIIENISGGGGNIGTDRFARSPPDGYTLMFSPPGPLTINQLLYGDVAYDPAKFVLITARAGSECADHPDNSRCNIGRGPHCAGESRSGQAHLCVAGRRLDRLPDGQAVRDESGCPDGARAVSRRRACVIIVAGHVDMMFNTIVTSLPLHRAGSARILAIANAERSSALPQVPTFASSGCRISDPSPGSAVRRCPAHPLRLPRKSKEILRRRSRGRRWRSSSSSCWNRWPARRRRPRSSSSREAALWGRRYER